MDYNHEQSHEHWRRPPYESKVTSSGAVTIFTDAQEAITRVASGEPGTPSRPETDGSRLENGATGYAVTWKNGKSWKGHKTHMGWGQEAFDAKCGALARALQVAATRSRTVGSVTIFTDAQAAI